MLDEYLTGQVERTSPEAPVPVVHVHEETVVLGGIFETERRETINKVPVLGDLPGVGRLFKSSSDRSNKAELLIFVTPKILREGSNIY